MFFITRKEIAAIKELQNTVEELKAKIKSIENKTIIAANYVDDTNNKRRWTEEEDTLVIKSVNTQIDVVLLASLLNRTEAAVKARASTLGYSIKDYNFIISKDNK